MRNAQATDAAGIQSIERAARVLELVAAAHRKGMRLSKLAEASGLNKATVHRLVGTLVALGWIELDANSGLYFPGLNLLRLGVAAANRHDLVALASPHLAKLAHITSDTVYLLVRSGDSLVCVDQVEGQFPVRVKLWDVGDRARLASNASSLAVLALLPDTEMLRIVDSQLTTIAELSGLDRAGMLHLVERTRAHGYANNSGVSLRGLDAVAAAVRDASGAPVAAVCIAAIAPRLEGERGDMVVRWLKEETLRLEQTLNDATFGFSVPALSRQRRR